MDLAIDFTSEMLRQPSNVNLNNGIIYFMIVLYSQQSHLGTICEFSVHVIFIGNCVVLRACSVVRYTCCNVYMLC